jgi:aminocarboxymuconate-semialdehyde decarboxylase
LPACRSGILESRGCCHLGGAIPYLAERLDRGWRCFEDSRADVSRPPSEFLRQFYYDTVNFDPTAVRLAVDFAGADRVLAASDYPHQIGSIPLMKESLAALNVSASERAKILSGNAAKLYLE